MPPNPVQPAASALERIPARTRRHAMDWSLVLASQGIDAVIEHQPDSGWALVVPAADCPRALESIRQYRRENRRWPWRRKVLQRRLGFDWGAAVWTLLVLVFFSATHWRPALCDAALMDATRFAQGQWWRVFTAVWLHADSAHLAANATMGLLLLGLAMGRYGTGVGLLAAYLAGAVGNVGDWLVYRNHHLSLGASGMVMAALGLLAVQSLSLGRQPAHSRKVVLGGIAAGLMLFVLLGLAPQTDVVAHFGGFLGGLALGALLSPVPRLAHNGTANFLAGFLFAFLVLLPWQRAIATL